jgi:hypothetical protein
MPARSQPSAAHGDQGLNRWGACLWRRSTADVLVDIRLSIADSGVPTLGLLGSGLGQGLVILAGRALSLRSQNLSACSSQICQETGERKLR